MCLPLPEPNTTTILTPICELATFEVVKAASALEILAIPALLAGCGEPFSREPITAEKLQIIASEGCHCMQKDPAHRWWSRASQMMGEANPPCWRTFDRAVRKLHVTEEAVAACGPGSEAAPLTIYGEGMPVGGATIFLRYAFNGCTADESKLAEKKHHQKVLEGEALPGC